MREPRRLPGRLVRRSAAVAVVGALAAASVGPAAFAASTLATGRSGSIVFAGPTDAAGGFGGFPGGGFPGGGPPGGMPPGGFPGGGFPRGAPPGGFPDGGGSPGGSGRGGGGMGGLLDATTPDAEVVTALRDDADSYTWVAAAVGSQNAAGLQLGAEQPVLAVGGFNGSDPSPTLAEFQQYVADGEIHWFLAGGGFPGQQGGSTTSSQIADWVAATFTEVTLGGQTFYDLTAPVGAGS